jgi:putative endonuclease
MANRSQSHYLGIGVLGEDLVTQWLRFTSWTILERRWSCRWGEIDIIARFDPVTAAHTNKQSPMDNSSPLLAFIEVKTRSHSNWDAGGMLSITSRKQAKLWQTARCFLATHPSLAAYPCRFDVALVCYQRVSTESHNSAAIPATFENLPIHLRQAVEVAGYQMLLQDYIPSAFEGLG